VLTINNGKNEIQRINAFSKPQVHHTIGSFNGPIMVNKTSVSNKLFSA